MAWQYTLGELAHVVGATPQAPDLTFRRVSTDTRRIEPGDVFFALRGENFDGNRFVVDAFDNGACAAVTRDPSDKGPCLLVNDPLEALQAFAGHHRQQLGLPVFALTGSCGKTTAKDMTAAVLATRYRVVKTQGNLNNDIGCPLSLLQMDSETDIAVIEMGANHLGEIAGLCAMARPTEAAITMVAPAHLEGFGSIENVARAKGEIVEALDEKGIFYVNNDNEWCRRIGERFGGRKVRFGSSGDVVLESFEFTGPGQARLRVAPVGELRLPLACRAHAVNVLLAVAVGLQHGATEFQGPLGEHCRNASRVKVASVGPLTVMDDSYNANPASMAAALEMLADWPCEGRRMAALGEMLELGEAAAALHRSIGTEAGRCGVEYLFAKGPHACDTISGARSARVPHAEAMEDPADIARAIHEAARPGDVLLVKGSRGMRMECVIEALREALTQEP